MQQAFGSICHRSECFRPAALVPTFKCARSKPRLFDLGKSDALKASGTAVASFICTFCDMEFAD